MPKAQCSHVAKRSCLRLWRFGLLLACIGSADAQSDNAGQGIAFKLTPSYYSTSDDTRSLDINLRGNKGPHTAWLGQYNDGTGFAQTRTGYEYRSSFEWARTVLSAQLASGGFAGGSVSAEIGHANYAIVGWGRTNLANYYNLNFDPNDAITLGFGTRALPKTELAVYHLWDDRLPTEQRVTHAVLRYKPSDSERWTLDLSNKRGLTGTGNWVNGFALSVTYDFGDYFARLAVDQNVNFSDNTQTRVSFGLRF